jgi:hypothetical protein
MNAKLENKALIKAIASKAVAISTKRCGHCKRMQPVETFAKDRAKKTGHCCPVKSRTESTG